MDYRQGGRHGLRLSGVPETGRGHHRPQVERYRDERHHGGREGHRIGRVWDSSAAGSRAARNHPRSRAVRSSMYTHGHLGVRDEATRSSGAPHLMTRDPVGRRGVEVIDTIRRLDAGTILTTILVVGLALRVFIAGVYLPLSGFAIDIGDFTAWGQRLASLGPSHFYEQGYFSDYPPGYLYVLWVLGAIGALIAPVVGQDATAGLVKIPGIAADIGVAWLLFVIARWGAALISSRHGAIRAESLGVVAAALYLFNPGTIFDSAVWG